MTVTKQHRNPIEIQLVEHYRRGRPHHQPVISTDSCSDRGRSSYVSPCHKDTAQSNSAYCCIANDACDQQIGNSINEAVYSSIGHVDLVASRMTTTVMNQSDGHQRGWCVHHHHQLQSATPNDTDSVQLPQSLPLPPPPPFPPALTPSSTLSSKPPCQKCTAKLESECQSSHSILAPNPTTTIRTSRMIGICLLLYTSLVVSTASGPIKSMYVSAALSSLPSLPSSSSSVVSSSSASKHGLSSFQ